MTSALQPDLRAHARVVPAEYIGVGTLVRILVRAVVRDAKGKATGEIKLRSIKFDPNEAPKLVANVRASERRAVTDARGRAIPGKFEEVEIMPQGVQLYALGGNQDLSMVLSPLGAQEVADEQAGRLFDIGEIGALHYNVRKPGNRFRPVIFQHDLEEGAGPHLLFNPIARVFYFVGGRYRVQPEGIVG